MTRRDESLGIRAGRAAQVLDNPEFQAAFDDIRTGIISEMERLELTGDNDHAAAVLMLKLQAAKEYKAELVRVLQAHDAKIKREERKEGGHHPLDPPPRPTPNH